MMEIQNIMLENVMHVAIIFMKPFNKNVGADGRP